MMGGRTPSAFGRGKLLALAAGCGLAGAVEFTWPARRLVEGLSDLMFVGLAGAPPPDPKVLLLYAAAALPGLLLMGLGFLLATRQ